ncbi:hypothetical protein S7711_03782 [Stachybotrys chartarum IBT 7711]|uniref:Uncharacterized protein n=1 Tax=Stachybotrys chartarum (strain CBS 109288 / IBT 7711) TaxID=1280523 RepID=A0A084AU61_STACB|nr:hypothetical protein S7711_03782 [Stachybotrys chartarum IBT 7711]KFA46949.1 hypothetical protein S40293_03645 [Stachybotrys chartarum IBT 40293]
MSAIVDYSTQTVRHVRPEYEASPKLNIEFLDTTCKDIFTTSWRVRIRKTENEDDLVLTYKKKIIMGSDMPAALTTTDDDIFDAINAGYKHVERDVSAEDVQLVCAVGRQRAE